MTTATQTPLLTPFLKRGDDGTPYLAASRCGACDEIFVGERQICAKCCTRGQMKPVRLAETGKLYAYTLVHRSFPGVKTPFIDVVVDLDDGAHLKGTLADIEPSLDALHFDMPVKIAYREVVPANAGGQAYLSYVFVPA